MTMPMLTTSVMNHIWRLLILLPVCHAVPDTGLSNVCGPDWLDFNGSCYKLTEGRLGGTVELDYGYLTGLCQEAGALPATLARALENEVARSLLTTGATSGDDAAFIGLFRDSPSEEWRWHDGAPLYYNNWEQANSQKALVRTSQTAALTSSGQWRIVTLSQTSQRDIAVLCEKRQPPSSDTQCQRGSTITKGNDAGESSGCTTISVYGSKYHPETSGKYQLHEGETCDNSRDIFDQDPGDNYISAHRADGKGLWMVGHNVCEGRYSLSANDIGPDPTRVTTIWREWREDGQQYVPNPNITVTCDVSESEVTTVHRVNTEHLTLALSVIFGGLCLVLTGLVIMLCKTRAALPKQSPDTRRHATVAPQELALSGPPVTSLAVPSGAELTTRGEEAGSDIPKTPETHPDWVRIAACPSPSNNDNVDNIYASLSGDEAGRSCYEDIDELTWPKTRISVSP